MARIRSVHPDICVSETIEDLDDADLEVTFVRLWTHCDDHGRCPDNLLLIKAAIYPLRERVTSAVLDGWLDKLAGAGLILRYEAGGKRYISVRSWGEFQHPNRPKDSRYPAPPDMPPPGAGTDPTGNGHVTDTDASVTTHGRDTPGEGEGGEREGESERAADDAPTLTLVLDPPPPSAAELATQRFEEHLWPTYPKRDGKKLGKAKALQQWLRLSVDDQRSAVMGARHYATACNSGVTMAKDAVRWLRDRCWEEWQEPATPDRQRGGPPPASAFPEASSQW